MKQEDKTIETKKCKKTLNIDALEKFAYEHDTMLPLVNVGEVCMLANLFPGDPRDKNYSCNFINPTTMQEKRVFVLDDTTKVTYVFDIEEEDPNILLSKIKITDIYKL